MTVSNFLSKAFCYQDLRRGELCAPGERSDKNTLGQIELNSKRYAAKYRDQKCFNVDTLAKRE